MLLLDTHAFIWLVSEQRSLTKRGIGAIAANAGSLAISGITGLEIALLEKRDRLELPLPAPSFIARALEHHGITEIPVTVEIGCRAASLRDIHNDPFDRIIIATCQIGNHELLTKDQKVQQYPDLRWIW